MTSVDDRAPRFTLTEEAGVHFLESMPGEQLMRSVEDASLVVEACASSGVDCVLLYEKNLTNGFFDLSSREAGAVLQKLRNYRIRVAVVYVPGGIRFSSRFPEMAAEESRSHQFRLFESRQAAREWLTQPIVSPPA